jgi:hypothetical protein
MPSTYQHVIARFSEVMLTSKQGIILEAARPVVGQTELPHYINLSVLYNKQRGAFSAIDTS